MQINLGIGGKRSGFSIEYDAIGYEAEEIRKIGLINCDLLGLEVQEVVAS